MTGTRVPHYIGHCLLCDAIAGDLDSGGQQRWRFRRLDRHQHAARMITRRLLVERAHQPQIVERSWAQLVDHAANVGDGRLRMRCRLSEQRLRGPRVVAQQLGGGG